MSGSLLERILAEIEASGPIGFGRYLELALYDPTEGFYARGGAGRRRDFITSPEVGPLFGAVVARALDEWWDELGRPDRFIFAEAGAGEGTLARSIHAASPACLGSLDYIAVETSAQQREGHPAAVISASSLPEHIDVGVVFANELLDNLPFDLMEWRPERGWHQIRIGRSGDELVEVAVAATGLPPAPAVPTGSAAVRYPVHLAATQWVREALGRIGRGRLVVLDYMVDRYPCADPGREWLRTYRAHDRGSDPLVDPGSQDVTVDVGLDQLAAVADPTRVASQAEWLRRHGIDQLVDEGRRYWADHAASPDVRALVARSRIGEAEALVDASGLGAFTVVEWDVGL